MQEESDSLVIFLDRFNALGVRFGESVVQSCKRIGLSRSLFYELRDGKRPVKSKTWLKLEAAEREAGIGVKQSDEKPLDLDQPLPEDAKYAALQKQISDMQAQLTTGLERLAARGIKPQDVIDEIRAIAKRIGKWPIPPEDGAKQPWLVLAEYRELEATQTPSAKRKG